MLMNAERYNGLVSRRLGASSGQPRRSPRRLFILALIHYIRAVFDSCLARFHGRRQVQAHYYKQDFLKYSERLGIEGVGFKSLIPKLYFPSFLQESLGYRTHARVSLPVLNPRTHPEQRFR
jgi:hypothetical protein